ncbi:MAG TPA: hypothetical protein VK894_05715 [Jiangellales bacterium]|nr:hypothetical protein [Jiangellales bacterium]
MRPSGGRSAAAATAAGRRRRVAEPVVVAGVAGVTALLACLPKLREPLFYHWGDNAESFVPLWHHLGTELRAGRWSAMDPERWMGGNDLAEAAHGVLNPVTMTGAVVVSFTDDLARATFLLAAAFLALLATGVYLLAREYGAARWPAAAVAVAAPFSGFTLFYEAGNWLTGLMAAAWTTHTWWSLRRFTRGRLTPLVPFGFGVLAVTTGNPYATVGVVVVLAALAVEVVVQRQGRRLLPLVLLGASIGTATLLVFLPFLLTSDVTWRVLETAAPRPGYLRPGLDDLLGLSTPTYRPTMAAWGGDVDKVPSTYLAWFVLPLLPWLRWDRLAGRARDVSGLLAGGGIFLALTLGATSLWMFRWPLRMIEYSSLTLAVLFAVALTDGFAHGRVRVRAALSVAVVLAGGLLAWGAEPDRLARHAGGVAVVLALLALLALAARRGAAATLATLVAGTTTVLVVQSGLFWWTNPALLPVVRPHDVAVPHDLALLREATEPYEGRVLQVASVDAPLAADDLLSGRVMTGHVWAAAGVRSVNSYSGIGFVDFVDTVRMDYRGDVVDRPYVRLWEPTGDGVPVPLVDALRVDTVVVQDSYVPGVSEERPPSGWRVALADGTRTVLVRSRPLADVGSVAWASPGTRVSLASSAPHRETLDVDAPAGGGTVQLARLAWPGYSASVDGEPLEVVAGPAGLVVLEVPEGEHRVELRFSPPGLGAGAAAFGLGLLVVTGLAVVERRRRITPRG